MEIVVPRPIQILLESDVLIRSPKRKGIQSVLVGEIVKGSVRNPKNTYVIGPNEEGLLSFSIRPNSGTHTLAEFHQSWNPAKAGLSIAHIVDGKILERTKGEGDPVVYEFHLYQRRSEMPKDIDYETFSMRDYVELEKDCCKGYRFAVLEKEQ